MTSTIIRGALAAAVTATAALLPVAAPAALASAGRPQLTGTVTAYDGKFDLRVRSAAGTVESVQLHRGTIINPTGLTLQPGMKVSILGDAASGVLDAQEIDTPYHITQPAYAAAGGYGGYGPYGGFGPYGYGFGPYAAFGGYPLYGAGTAFGFGY